MAFDESAVNISSTSADKRSLANVERNISAFDLRQLGDVGDQSVHAFGISTDDGEESTTIVGVVDRAVLERFDICKDRSKWCAKLVRNVRKKFLSDVLKAFKLSDVVKDADRLTVSRRAGSAAT